MIDPTPTDRAKAVVSRLHREGGVVSADPAALEQMIATEIQAESNAQLMRNRAVDRQADVAAFHRKFGVPCPERPGWPSQERIDLRVRLIAEEFCEFLRDCGLDYTLHIERWFDVNEGALDLVFASHTDREEPSPVANFPKAADALIDLEYVILGTHNEFGINSTPLWAEVQKCNMAKEGGATREDGKILKPAGWVGPDIEGALRAQGWSEAGAIEEAKELSETERGDKGFGSTGR